MSDPRLLVVQHEDNCPPAWFGVWIASAGVDLHVVRPYAGDDLPDPVAYDGLMVLGGEMGANDDAEHHWLGPTKQRIREAVGGGVPFLGICLGHQLGAVALGGRVDVNPSGITRGLTPVTLDAAGHDDPLLGDRNGHVEIQWNYDVVTELPSGAVRLASSPDGTVQAVRYAPTAWGLQFHPEAYGDVVDAWGAPKPGQEATAEEADTVREVTAQVRDAEGRLAESWRPVAERFAEVVVRHGASRRQVQQA